MKTIGAAEIPDTAQPIERPCGCLYDAVRRGTGDTPWLLAQCAGCAAAQDRSLQEAEREAQRPIKETRR
mgnify:FL=1